MNPYILHKDVQEFINANLNTDISRLILKGSPFENVDIQELVEQIEAKKKCKKKLPSWFNTTNIYYPNKLNIEQTSSEITANHKASLVFGTSLIDITGGFGVDTYAFSKKIEQVTHCEIHQKLSEIASYNFNRLKSENIECVSKSGIDYLKENHKPFDWIYADPSRRDDSKQKVFLLTDCEPNLKTFKGLLLNHAPNVMIKTSPLLDLSKTIEDLEYTKDIHIIAVNNEVKELLFILEHDYNTPPKVHTINIQKKSKHIFSFNLEEEAKAEANISLPLKYIYEPNAAVLKSGAFKLLSKTLEVGKLHQHSHLYTSDVLKEFPGRRFKIETTVSFNKKEFSKLKIDKANITTRNFPVSVQDIRKKFKIKDGGAIYLFFTTNCNDEKIVIVCSKI